MHEAESQFTALYKEFHPRVLAYAMRRSAPDVAHETADETFLIAWLRWDAVPADAVLPWLLVVARNILSDRHRRGRRRDALALEIANATFGMSEPGLDTAVVERITVLSALAQLSVKDREVLLLTVWDGLSNRDAATVAGCSPATFAVRLYRARRRLADALEQLDAQPGRAGAHETTPVRPTAPPHPIRHLNHQPVDHQPLDHHPVDHCPVDHRPVTASKEEQR